MLEMLAEFFVIGDYEGLRTIPLYTLVREGKL